MSNIQALILGLIQGLTEFLPISSTGHLSVFQHIFGIDKGVLSFDVAVHFATLIAIVVVFWKDILELIKHPFSKLTLLIIVATIPTGIIGIAFKGFFDSLATSGKSLGIEFIITGLIILYADKAMNRHKGLEKTTAVDAGIIGVAQGIAILPAISRSGLTIAGALFRGLDREFAAKLSFLISIPAILGATLLDAKDLFKANQAAPAIGMTPTIIGMIAAGISGYFAIRFMLKIISKGKLKGFAYYVFILGGLILIDQLFTGIFFDKIF